MKNTTAYFAADGNYGNADDLKLIDVSEWTQADWEQVENENDSDRLYVAKGIAERYWLANGESW